MGALIWVFGFIAISYGGVLIIVKMIRQSTWKEAMQIIASFFKNNEYELQYDTNFITEVNHIIRSVVGEQQYQQLCRLNVYSSTVIFTTVGIPTVSITVKPKDDSERIQLENIMCTCTRRYIANYKLPENIVKFTWDANYELNYPVLKIYYPRTIDDIQLIKSELKVDIDKIVISNSDVTDDEEDLQNE